MDRIKTPFDPHARGRGALSNRDNRFERLEKFLESDGWDIDEERAVVRTETRIERPRKIISRNTSPDLDFDCSINPYRGCEHGCVYCFARPSHAYLGLSPGLDFETQLLARPNAPILLEKELSSPRYVPKMLAIGTNTDAYQPIERSHRIMRQCLRVLQRFRHPVAIVTKGTLIERDIDILGEMAADGLARVGVSVTTLDPNLSRKMEPRVPSPERRLETIRKLSDAGIPVRIMASPMIPGLSDHELESILEAGNTAGAKAASAILLRLPREVAGLFEEWLQAHYPNRAEGVLRKMCALHGGKLYNSQFGTRQTGKGLEAELLQKRLQLARRRLGLSNRLPALRSDLFKVPPKAGDQLTLF